jgi:uncharacterized protein YaiL (DUF2058 family)
VVSVAAFFGLKAQFFGGLMKHGYFKGNKVAEVQDSQTSLMNKFKKQGIVDEWREADPKKVAEAKRLEAEKAAAEKAEAEQMAAKKEAEAKAEAERLAKDEAERIKRLEAEKAKGSGNGTGGGNHDKK